MAPILVVLAGFIAGLLLASTFIDVGGGNEAASVITDAGDPGAEPMGGDGAVGGGGFGDQLLAEDQSDESLAGDQGDEMLAGDQGEELQLAPLVMDDGERNFITADRYEVRFGGGLLYLTGALPDKETADVIVKRAGDIVGPENLVVDHTFDPSVVIEPDIEIPIVIDDLVYFETGSATITPEFYPLIDLGVLLLTNNPQASITVLTYTDARGSEESNMELSRQRAQAIQDYLVLSGGNPEQLILDPRGEEGAIEGVSAELAAEERRAEFILNGFLNGLFDS